MVLPCDNLYDYDFLYYADDSGDHEVSVECACKIHDYTIPLSEVVISPPVLLHLSLIHI